MLLDLTRRTPPPGPSLNTGEGAVVAVAKSASPVEQVADDELIRRCKPRLSTHLHEALRLFQTQRNPRRAHVAWLWLPYRTPQVAIGQLLGVTKERVCQLVKEVRRELLAATEPTCRELSNATGIPLAKIQTVLWESPHDFIRPAIHERLLAAFRGLQSERPQLAQLGFLQWKQQRSLAEIADQLGESTTRVVYLREQLEAWKQETCERIAADLCEESGVPLDMLRARVEAGFREAPGAETEQTRAELAVVG